MQRVPEERAELNVERAIEPELVANSLVLLLRNVCALRPAPPPAAAGHHDQDGITGKKMEHREDEERGSHEHQNRGRDA